MREKKLYQRLYFNFQKVLSIDWDTRRWSIWSAKSSRNIWKSNLKVQIFYLFWYLVENWNGINAGQTQSFHWFIQFSVQFFCTILYKIISKNKMFFFIGRAKGIVEEFHNTMSIFKTLSNVLVGIYYIYARTCVCAPYCSCICSMCHMYVWYIIA